MNYLYLFLFSLSISTAFAVPAQPGLIDVTQNGHSFSIQLHGDEFFSWASDPEGFSLMANSRGEWCYAEDDGMGGQHAGSILYEPGFHPDSALRHGPEPAWFRQHIAPLRQQRDDRNQNRLERVEGEWNLLLIMIHFPDQDPRYEPANFEAMMNEENYNGTGSFRDYYQDLSYGRYGTTGIVTQWYEAEHPHDYYGYAQGWSVAQELVIEAISAADSTVDFSQFDNSGDGLVDALMIVHSGGGAEEGDQTNIWSHRWALWGQELNLDGVLISDYTMQPEIQNSQQSAIGVYVHEFGHNLGLPDLYDTDYSSSGVGTWCVMSGGSWGGPAGGGAHTPVRFSAWCRKQLGWATVQQVEGELPDHALAACTDDDTILEISLPDSPGQSFLCECRPNTAWDQHLAGNGLLIYHIDENQSGNSDENHFLVDVEQADGMRDLNHGHGADSGDPFPGSTQNTTFDENSAPSSLFYGAGSSSISVQNIRLAAQADTVYADFFQLFPHQLLHFLSWELLEDEDGDDWPSPGETITFAIEAQNIGAPLASLHFQLEEDPARYEILDGEAQIFEIAGSDHFTTESDPFTIRLLEELPAGQFTMNLMTTDHTGWTALLEGLFTAGRAQILLVDDQEDPALASWLQEPLEALEYTVERRSIQSGHSPDDLQSYENILWMTGNSPSPLAIPEWNAMAAYCENGGHLLLSGQDLLANQFIPELLVFSADLGTWQDVNPSLAGHEESGIFDPQEMLLLIGGLGAWNQAMPTRALSVLEGGTPLLTWPSGDAAALRKSWPASEGRLVFAAFSLESIHGLSATMLSRQEVLDRLFYWLETGSEVSVDAPFTLPRSATLALAPNPFNPVTQLRLDLIQPCASAHLRVFNLMGEEVLNRVLPALPIGSSRFELNLSHVASGIYVLQVEPLGQAPVVTRALLLK